MHKALRRAVEICRDETFVAGLDVFTELNAREYHVRADHARIMQIAWNLVRNAAKFTPAGGQLVIRTSNAREGNAEPARASGTGGPGCLVIEFADTGIGIAPSVLPQDLRCLRAGPPRPARPGARAGAGAGHLPFARRGDGRPAHGLQPGPGSARRSAWRSPRSRRRRRAVAAPAPLSGSARRAPAGGPARPAPEPSLRVLLVEDNEDTLRYLATVLRRRGHDVVTADTIAAARQALGRADRPFELLLSDIELPDGTGLELMRDLRDRGEIPGIAMSGFGAEEDIQLSRTAGFFDHLIKPIDTTRLDAAIRRAAETARAGAFEPRGGIGRLEQTGLRFRAIPRRIDP